MQKTKLHFQRFEMKYQIPETKVQGLIPEFLKYMEYDNYAKEFPSNTYSVSSLYYDSAGFDSYYQKIAGLRLRKKIRIRFYDGDTTPDGQVFLEIKRKRDLVVIKDRLALSRQNCYFLLKESKFTDLKLGKSGKQTLDEFLWLQRFNSMIPQNMVTYQRQPLVSKIDPNFRVTIDRNIQTYLADWIDSPGHARLVHPGIAVLEVKFNNILPFWFHGIIQRYSLEHQPFSKYCNALEVCRPELADRSMIEVYQNNYATFQ